MSDTLTFGISRFPGSWIDSFAVKTSVEIAERANSIGEVGRVYPYKRRNEITIKGGGLSPLAVGVIATPGVTNPTGAQTAITGGVFVGKDVTETEYGEKFNEFDVSAMHYPSATAATAPTLNTGS